MSAPAFYKSFAAITSTKYVNDANHYTSFGLTTKGGGVRIRHGGGGAGAVTFSFTGQQDHGAIAAGDVDLVFVGIRASQIYFKGGNGLETVEVYAWTDL